MIYELSAGALQHIFLNLFLMSLSINFLGNILMMLEAGVNEVYSSLHIFRDLPGAILLNSTRPSLCIPPPPDMVLCLAYCGYAISICRRKIPKDKGREGD